MSTITIAAYFPFARVKVVSQTAQPQSSSAQIRLQPDRRWRPLCHQCQTPAGSIHSVGHRRLVRDLNLADREVWLQIEYRKVWCSRCGRAKVEHLDFCDAGKRITHRLARYIYELCKLLPVAQVARHLDLDPKTVKAIDKQFLEQQFGQTDYEGLRLLAIDEISTAKGHHYLTVVLDYVTGRVVWVGEGHDKYTLDNFFAGMTDLQKKAIQAVAIDIWDPYINRLEHHCPQAMIVFDLFHVVKAYSRVIDEVRRAEVRKATGPTQKAIKGSRYLLLRNSENLQEEQKDRLKELLELNATLNAVYVLKDQLKVIYRYQRRPAAKQALDQWIAAARQVDNPWMDKFIRTLRKRQEGILNHCQFPIGTSRLEGVNNKIKVIQRQAYGFHDTRYFGLKIKQAFPGHEHGQKTSNFLG